LGLEFLGNKKKPFD